MKKRILLTTLIACTFFVCLAVVLSVCEADAVKIRQSVFRFHVIANSNSTADQQNKLAVRDGIADLCSQLFKNSNTKAQSMEIAKNSLKKIEAEAKKILVSRGDNSTVTATVKQRFFPTRHYEGVSLPAGVYDTLDIEIGNAEGKNFWCVLFPDICLGASTKTENTHKMTEVLSGDSLKLATDDNEPSIKFKFKIIEIFESAKNFFSTF